MMMTVMQVRIMRMLVQDSRVLMPVTMRLSHRIGQCVLVLVVDVVHVPVLMLEGLMQVLVIMGLGEVQIDADPHQHGCGFVLNNSR
jgi:hypothetical protein